MSKKIYEMVTKNIIEKLENGVVPWKRPFTNRCAVNWMTQKPYRGINTLLLLPGEYATFRQIKKAGGKVKKGEKSNLAIFWKWIEKENEETGEEEYFPLLRYYNLFEINTQVDGLESNRVLEDKYNDPIKSAEKLVQKYKDAPEITFQNLGAWYRPKEDRVNVPPLKDFIGPHEYYSTLFHELIHSTGHERRLSREGITNFDKFGSVKYTKEELVAEIGASMLCSIAGIDNETIDNSASYIQSWLNVLKDDHRFVIQASQQAQKATDYILGITHENGEVKEEEMEVA